MIPHDTHLHIGSLLFEGIDQIDLTGPFEVLSRIPNATYRIYGTTTAAVRDLKGLRLTPDATLIDAPPLDVLHVPGGHGQEALMEDAEVLAWLRRQAEGACSIFSVCTDHALEVIAIVAASTITNYTGSVTKTPLEAAFQAHAWNS
jgi:cyclohexyl-isocyanide hydratase